MALPTKGRVVIETTAGDIDIELWSKEAPKACRNFLALAMEGYYDGVIFHRIVPDFLVQTGDRTGTGGGGESFFGEPFEDEIHPRLRFAHRGLVAMANNGTKNSNDSQFFITLDRADELHGKHTLFGRCVGDTIYNVMKIGAMEIDENGRPLYPPKIRSIRIIENPFDDIVPRITAEEKRAQQRAREQAKLEREEHERRKGAKKDTKLLSFGADEETEGESSAAAFRKKNIVRPDLVDNPEQSVPMPDIIAPPKPAKTPKSDDRPVEKPKKADKPAVKGEPEDLSRIREKHSKEQAATSNSRQAEIEKMEAEIRKLSKRGNESDDEPAKKKVKKSYLEEELSKYSKGRGLHKKDRKKDESDVLAALSSFRSKLQSSKSLDRDDEEDEERRPAEDGEAQDIPGEGDGMEVDDDRGFMSHLLHFPKGNEEEVQKAERDYEVIDPRQRGAKAREEERERKRAMKQKGGGRGYRR
ncbi:cyclophilin-like protein [Dentipellis sp. KUC8613]|nr:cyclophilin-like protein [Dentipellis sp. KUC8613]